ncbi:MAG: 8-oxo-dGTP diphosphatase [Candidatus Paceibacteria bacterium]|jgi:8-oxo-dGTP diphosphatase
MNKNVRVGVAVIIKKDHQVILGERKGAHGEGTWGFPGGHLEFGETLEQCAIREVAEENGLVIANVRFADFTEDFFVTDDKHYLTVFMLADYVSGEAQVLEPAKCNSWKWFEWGAESLPENIFLPIKNLFKKTYNPFN